MNKPATRNVCVIGNNATDLVFFTKRSLRPGEKMEAQAFEEFAGGTAANAAYTMAALGLPVRYIGPFGDDYYARLSRTSLEQVGIDTQFCPTVSDCRNAVANVMVGMDDGERTSSLFADPRLEQSVHVQEAMLDDCSMLYTDGNLLSVAVPLAKMAQERAMMVIADIESVTPETLQILEHASIVIAPASIIQRIASDMSSLRTALMMICRSHGPVMAVATMGEEGCEVFSEQMGHTTVSAYPCTVVDTTGAGDAFHAGFVAATYQGKDIPSALDFASKLAAATCECEGPRITRERLARL